MGAQPGKGDVGAEMQDPLLSLKEDAFSAEPLLTGILKNNSANLIIFIVVQPSNHLILFIYLFKMRAPGLYLAGNEELLMFLEYLTDMEHVFFDWKRL